MGKERLKETFGQNIFWKEIRVYGVRGRLLGSVQGLREHSFVQRYMCDNLIHFSVRVDLKAAAPTLTRDLFSTQKMEF